MTPQADPTGAPGDEHSPASSHEWPQDPAPATADPFPHRNGWGEPDGVVPGFSQDGPYHSVHESTGPTDREVGTYDQRAAALVEPTYQPYGPHGSYEPFIQAHSTPDGNIAWPPNQGADGPRVVVQLPAGTVLDRFGSPYGNFLSPLRPDGLPYGFGQRAILPDSLGKGYHVYVLDAPLTVELATVAPAFDQPGGARQLQPVFDADLADPTTGQISVQRLIDLGVMREVATPPADGRVLPPDFGTFDGDGNVRTPETASVAEAQAGAFDGHPRADGPADLVPNPDLGPVSHTGPIPLGEVSQRVDQAIRNSQVTDAGVALHTEDRLRDLSARIPASDGQVVLDVHTDGDGVRIGGTHYSRAELVELINNHPDLAGRTLVFVGCEAGAGGEHSIAAHVARETGQRVIAPDALAWSDQHGNVYSSTRDGDGPRIPPDGGWHAFDPDGAITPTGEHGMPPGHEPKGDLATADDSAHRAIGDLEPQRQTPWTEPPTTHRQTVQLPNDQTLFDGRDLPRDTRIEVRNPDGQVRSVVHVDAQGRIFVDAVAPNTRHGVNPEISFPPRGEAQYRVQVGNRNDVFVANDDGTRRYQADRVRVGNRTITVNRLVTIDDVVPPANGRQTIGADHPMAPRPGEAFTQRTDLPPNTRMEVTDTAGNYRGTVQTDGDGRPKWISAPDYLGGRPNPELTTPIGGANYNVDRGPHYQEYRTDSNGHPEPGVSAVIPPTTGDPIRVDDVRQGRPFAIDPKRTFEPNREYVVHENNGQYRGRFITGDDGKVIYQESYSGQRGRTNPEVTHAPDGANVTTDGFYGTRRQLDPGWPAPPNGEVRVVQEVSGNPPVRTVRVEGDTSGWTPRQLAEVERPVGNRAPFAGRDLPPGTRFTLVDEEGRGYGTFQTDETGAARLIHTYNPFNPDMNNAPPNAVIVADDGMWRGRTDSNGRAVAATGVPDFGAGGEIRRDTKAQTDEGSYGGKGSDGKNLSDGGHLLGNEAGFPAEGANIADQQRDQNQGNERPAFLPEETWYQMERDRAEFVRGGGGTVELIDTFALREPGQLHPHTYQTRWRETLADGTTRIHVRSYPNDHNAALWPAEF